MKKLILIFVAAILAVNVIAQAPDKLGYQAVVRNSSGMLVANDTVSIQISILQGSINGTTVYTEVQTPSANLNGLISFEIGGGNPVSGIFSDINWSVGPYFIKTEIDPDGGSNYTITTISQLLSVPYALYAKKAEGLTNGITSILPVLTTTITNTTSNSATFGGTINVNGNRVIEKGIVYSTSPYPIVNSDKIVIEGEIFQETSGLGYLDNLLVPGTLYHARAYAITENNMIAYGNDIPFNTHSLQGLTSDSGIVFFDKGDTIGGWRYLIADTITGTSNWTDAITNWPTLTAPNQWFLPSIDELNLVYKNVPNFLQDEQYWSSTQDPNYPDYVLLISALNNIIGVDKNNGSAYTCLIKRTLTIN